MDMTIKTETVITSAQFRVFLCQKIKVNTESVHWCLSTDEVTSETTITENRVNTTRLMPVKFCFDNRKLTFKY